jgi:hypothetical protein
MNVLGRTVLHSTGTFQQIRLDNCNHSPAKSNFSSLLACKAASPQ